MARIAGVDLPRTKRVEIGLTYIYGIGRVRSNKLLKEAGVSPDIRVKDLSEDDLVKLREHIEAGRLAKVSMLGDVAKWATAVFKTRHQGPRQERGRQLGGEAY